MTGWILLFSVLFALAWILWTPFYLLIDSAKGQFRVGWRHIAQVDWLPEEGLDVILIEAPFFRKKVVLGNINRKKDAEAKPVVISSKPGKKMSWAQIRKMALNVLRSFNIKYCRIFWDMGDYVSNAQLFPLFWFLRRRDIFVDINFQGRREVSLLIENRPGRLLWFVIKAFIFK